MNKTKTRLCKRYCTGIAISVLFCLLNISVFSQHALPAFRHYGTEEGLPSTVVNWILQDKTGYLWVATNGGVCRFDGHQFRVFDTGDGMEDANTVCLTEDRNGEIWALSNDGLVYRIKEDSLRPFEGNGIIKSLKNRFLLPHALVVHPESGDLYLSLATLGILRIAADGKSHEVITSEGAHDMIAIQVGGEWLSQNRTHSKKAEAMAPSENAGIEFLSSGKKKMVSGLNFSNPKILRGLLTQIGKERFLLYRNGCFYLIENGRLSWHIPFPEIITQVRLTKTGGIAISMIDKKELRRYSDLEALRNNRYEVLFHGAGARFSFEDQLGGLWVGTLDDGLFYAVNPQIRVIDGFQNIKTPYVTAMAKGPGTTMYAGLFSGELFSIDGKTLIASAKIPQQPEGAQQVGLAYHDFTGALWSGKRSLAWSDGKKWQEIEFENQKGKREPVRANSQIRFSPDGRRFWACSKLQFVEVDAQSHIVLDESGKWGISESFESILEDRQGRVWVGSERGLFEWKDHQLLDRNALHPALASGVVQVMAFRDGKLAVATRTGLLVMGADLTPLHLLTKENGLPDNRFKILAEDNMGHLWTGSNNGLAKIRFDQMNKVSVYPYTILHGLPANVIEAIVPIDQTVWVATSKGIAIIESGSTNKPVTPQAPRLSAFQVNNSLYSFGIKPDFSHSENNLFFWFTNLHFPTGDQTSYRYRLDPQQPWQYTSQPHLALYSLAPGVYRLDIAAQDENRKWSQALELPFRIRPPFWQTWWFWGIISLAMVTLLTLFYNYRLRVLRRELTLQQQAGELEKQALRAQMDPHFIFNCLNSIQNFIASNEKDLATAYLARFAKLIRQALDSSFQKDIALEDEIAYLENYLSLEHLRFKDAFHYEIKVDEKLDLYETTIPPMLVQPFLENAIQHGMKGKKNDGMILLQFEKLKENGLQIVIEDNGPGVSPNNAAASNHTSYGVSLTRRRLSLAAQYPNAQIRTTERPGGGARVEIILE